MKAESKVVPIELHGQCYMVSPDGTVSVERIANGFQLDEVRYIASDIYLTDKRRELSKGEFTYWSGIKRRSEA